MGKGARGAVGSVAKKKKPQIGGAATMGNKTGGMTKPSGVRSLGSPSKAPPSTGSQKRGRRLSQPSSRTKPRGHSGPRGHAGASQRSSSSGRSSGPSKTFMRRFGMGKDAG